MRGEGQAWAKLEKEPLTESQSQQELRAAGTDVLKLMPCCLLGRKLDQEQSQDSGLPTDLHSSLPFGVLTIMSNAHSYFGVHPTNISQLLAES